MEFTVSDRGFLSQARFVIFGKVGTSGETSFSFRRLIPILSNVLYQPLGNPRKSR
jgi:hypothetical protein